MAFLFFGGIGLLVGCLVAAVMRDRGLWAAGTGLAMCVAWLVFAAVFGGGEGSTVEKPLALIAGVANLGGWLLGVAAVVVLRRARPAQRSDSLS